MAKKQFNNIISYDYDDLISSINRSPKFIKWFSLVLMISAIVTILQIFKTSNTFSQQQQQQHHLYHHRVEDNNLEKNYNHHGASTKPQQTIEIKTRTEMCATIQSKLSLSAPVGWVKHIGNIFNASLYPNRIYETHDQIAELLRLVTPRLVRAQGAITTDWETIESVLNKANERYQYLQNLALSNNLHDNEHSSPVFSSSTSPPPPVLIVVMGGSVPFGVKCELGLKDGSYKDRPTCCWSYRLEQMINKLLVPEQVNEPLVRIYNAAVGASNSDRGHTILHYDLLPKKISNYDILIYAYSTNDSLDWHFNGRTHQGMLFDKVQNFASVALDSCNVKKPLLIYLDDFLGNQQRNILQNSDLLQVLELLSNYYGFGYASYPNAVRDLVYAKTHESIFTPTEWYSSPTNNTMQKENHPGYTAHTTMAWIMLFHFWQTITTYCSYEAWNVSDYESTLEYYNKNDSDNNDDNNVSLFLSDMNLPPPGMPKLRGHNGFTKDQLPRPISKNDNHMLPPPLTPDSSLDTISENWKPNDNNNNENTNKQQQQQQQCNKKQCPFSWFPQVTDYRNPRTFNAKAHFESIVTKDTIDNWYYHDDTGKGFKYGIFPNITTFDPFPTWKFDTNLTIQQQEQLYQNIIIFYLKSYGPKWEGSQAQITVQCTLNNGTAHEMQFSLYGYHTPQNSLTFSHEVHLPEAVDNLQISIQHKNGTTFKMEGIAICN